MHCLSVLSVIIFSLIHLDSGWIHNAVRGKAKVSTPAMKQVEERKRMTDKINRKADEATVDSCPAAISSPVSSPISRSPFKGEQQLLLLPYNMNCCGNPHL